MKFFFYKLHIRLVHLHNKQFELLISSGAEVTIEGIGRASDLAVKKTVNSKHKIFNEGEHGVWQPIIPTNNGAETRHLHLFAKHTRRSYFEKLYRAHLNQEVEAPASSPGISRF